MLFNSFPFIIFLAVALPVYYCLPRRWRNYHLFLSSYLFYCSWSVAFSILLLASSALVYAFGKKISDSGSEREKWKLLKVAVVSQLSILCFFKYFSAALEPMAGWLSLRVPDLGPSATKLLVPLGVSYFVFKLVSYVLDVYLEKIPPERDFISFGAYVSFFPQIVSGPIQRAGDFLPQLRQARKVPIERITGGAQLLLFGFFKKLVVADGLATLVNPVFGDLSSHAGWPLLLACYGFTLQLYADFSSITDIAVGCAAMFGIVSPDNFNNPFYSRNIQDFWRKWHITLTSLVRDYLFAPLQMQFRAWGGAGLVLAIFINMAVIGIWHGSTWNFLLFGIIHGIFMSVSVLTSKKRNDFFSRNAFLILLRKALAPVFLFHIVVFSFIFFRAASIADAGYILTHLLFRSSGGAVPADWPLLVLAAVIMEAVHITRKSESAKAWFAHARPVFRYAVTSFSICAMLLVIVLFARYESSPFIYFQF